MFLIIQTFFLATLRKQLKMFTSTSSTCNREEKEQTKLRNMAKHLLMLTCQSLSIFICFKPKIEIYMIAQSCYLSNRLGFDVLLSLCPCLIFRLTIPKRGELSTYVYGKLCVVSIKKETGKKKKKKQFRMNVFMLFMANKYFKL